MKIFLLKIGILLLFVGITYAIPDKPKQDKHITLSLTQGEVEVVLKALGELPLKESANVFFIIQQQTQSQLMPQQTTAPKDTTHTKTKKQ